MAAKKRKQKVNYLVQDWPDSMSMDEAMFEKYALQLEIEDFEEEVLGLTGSVMQLVDARRDTIVKLRASADYLDSIWLRCRVSKTMGTSASMVGGSLTIAGGILTALTAGAAAPVLIAGIATSSVGAATNIGTSLVEKILNSRQVKDMNQALGRDKDITLKLESQLDDIRRYKDSSNLSHLLKHCEQLLGSDHLVFVLLQHILLNDSAELLTIEHVGNIDNNNRVDHDLNDSAANNLKGQEVNGLVLPTDSLSARVLSKAEASEHEANREPLNGEEGQDLSPEPGKFYLPADDCDQMTMLNSQISSRLRLETPGDKPSNTLSSGNSSNQNGDHSLGQEQVLKGEVSYPNGDQPHVNGICESHVNGHVNAGPRTVGEKRTVSLPTSPTHGDRHRLTLVTADTGSLNGLAEGSHGQLERTAAAGVTAAVASAGLAASGDSAAVAVLKQAARDNVKYNPLDAGVFVESGKVIGQNSIRVAGQVIIGISAAFLVWDAIDLGFTISDLVRRQGSRAAKILREKAQSLEEALDQTIGNYSLAMP